MTTRREPIVAAGCLALVLMAACGGGASDDGATDTQATAPAVDDNGGDGDSPVSTDEPAPPASDAGVDTGSDGAGSDEATGATSDLDGPLLEPTITISYGPSFSPIGDQVALSPTGDRVAVTWTNADSGDDQVTVFDTTTGEMSASGVAELSGDMYWSADDQIVFINRQGAIQKLDPATLAEAEYVTFEAFSCNGSNSRYFDRDDGAYYGQSNVNGEFIICRLDIADGAVASLTDSELLANLAVALDGDTAYATSLDDDGGVVLLTLDAATMTVREETPTSSRAPVLAATSSSIVRAQEDGFEYVIEPSGTVVPLLQFIVPSYSGQHYVAWHSAGTVLIDAATADVVGQIEATESYNRFDWSSDDAVFGIFGDEGTIEIYRLG